MVVASLLGVPILLGTAMLLLVAVGTGASWANANLEPFQQHPRLAIAAAGCAIGWLLLVAVGAGAALGPWRSPAPPPDDRGRPAFPETAAPGDVPVRPWRGLLRPGPLVELITYVVAAIAMTWPLARHLTDQLTGYGDAEYFVWLGWRVGGLIGSGHLLPIRIPDVVWPYGFDLRLAEGYLPTIVNGLWNLVAPPVTAYNLSLLTATGLNLWAGRRLGKLVSDERLVWMLSAIAFATAPSVAVRLHGHHAVYFVFPTALVVEEAARFCIARTIRWVRLSVVLFLCYLCAAYFLVGAATILVAMCLVYALQRRLHWRRLVELGAAFALTAAMMSPFLLKRSHFERAETAAGRNLALDPDYRMYAADGLSLVAQPRGSTIRIPGAASLGSSFPDYGPEVTIFPGFLLLTGLVLFAALQSSLRWPLLVAATTLWILTLGPDPTIGGHRVLTLRETGSVDWLPYALLVKLPMLSRLRSPGRFGLVLPAVLTLAVAVAAQFVLARSGRRGLALVALGSVLLLLPNLVVPVPMSSLPFAAKTRAGLAEASRRAGPGDSVLEVPADCFGPVVGTSSALQIFHGLPAVGCQGPHLALPWWSGMRRYLDSRELAALRCHPDWFGYHSAPFPPKTWLQPGELARLRSDLGVRFLVINKRLLEVSECRRLRERGIAALEGFEVLSEDDRWRIIDLQGRPALSTAQRGHYAAAF
jgi:hypothetical protein